MPVSISGDGQVTGLDGYLYAGTRYYTSSGTFAKADPLGTGDIGLRAIRVRLIGGGGGGGGAEATAATTTCAASGGQGGVYGEVFVTDISGLAATETVTVGAGGAGGAAGANNGTAGGTTSFGASISVDGGKEGIGQTAGTPPRIRTAFGPNVGSTGTDVSIPGAAGNPGWALIGLFIPGAGGATALAPSSQTTIGVSTSSRGGLAGENYGGGGSGAGNGYSQSAVAGGNGADGIVIIDCFV